MSQVAVAMKQLETPEAKELAETFLIEADLQSSITAITIWHKKYSNPSSNEERTIGLSLFRDAIVQFIACFDKSAKFRLSRDDIYEEHNGGHIYFQWLQDVRDAYAAHRFGANRQCIVGVIRDSASGVTGVGKMMGVYAGEQSTAGPALIAFMGIAARYTANRIERLLKEVQQAVDTMSQAQIDALQIGQVYGIDPSEIRASRNEIQRRKKSSRKPPDTTPSSE
jgi:hypothetical protein